MMRIVSSLSVCAIKPTVMRRNPTQQVLCGALPGPDTEAEIQAGLGTVFDPHFVTLRVEHQDSTYRTLHLSSTLAVATRWREVIISHSNDESERVRALLSGHAPDGKPMKDPHLAFLPLAFVGHEHADGHLLGMGLLLPAGLTRDERRAALRVIAQVKQLKLGPLGVWNVTAVTESSPPQSLRSDTWTAHPEGATHWFTVTPVAFDRHPKTRNKADHQRELATIVAKSCERIGLPKPREFITTPVYAQLGSPTPSRSSIAKTAATAATTAILVFDKPVRGPVLIGAGRFRGYGVCRPTNTDEKGAG